MTEEFYNPDIMSKEEEQAWAEADKRQTLRKKEREKTAKILKGPGRKQKEATQ